MEIYFVNLGKKCNLCVLQVVPNPLLDFSAGVLRERFSAVIRKPVFTFTFDRYTEVSPKLLCKLRTARNLRAVVVSTPTAVKSFVLKYMEICHILDKQSNLAIEQSERGPTSRSTLSSLLGLSPRIDRSSDMSTAEIASLKQQAMISREIFNIFRGSIEIMDEVDLLLHPLKSELNWPLGIKEPLDFSRSQYGTGLRWHIPSHLLDAIFSCSGYPILAEMADSREAGMRLIAFHVLG